MAYLLAWIRPYRDGRVEAAFVAVGTSRPPAEATKDSEAEARAWVEDQARRLYCEVVWADPPGPEAA